MLYVLKNSDGLYVTIQGYFTEDVEHAEFFSSREKAEEKKAILEMVSDEFYAGLQVDVVEV